MPTQPIKKMPPEFEKKAVAIRAALEKFRSRLAELRRKRMGVMKNYLSRVEATKIEEVRKRIDTL